MTWRAGRDGIAHLSRGRDPKALCGAPATAERNAWPVARPCEACEFIVNESAAVPTLPLPLGSVPFGPGGGNPPNGRT